MFNVSLLGYYKYSNFFIENINLLFKTDIKFLNVILPIGISFYTFQLIAFLIDNYKGTIKNAPFLNYLMFITFFPQLIVGPIVNYKDIEGQYNDKSRFKLNYENIAKGLFIISIGLAKKVIIANFLLNSIGKINYLTAFNMPTINAWLGGIAYTFAYYFDFSGYADMAIGLGLLFNMNLPVNFNSPYKARNFADYWKRWHMTLSAFLKAYIFSPIFYKNKTSKNFAFAVFITYFVSGFWHGASWNFILWGLVNATLVYISHLMIRNNKKLPSIFAYSLTFLFVILAWVLFVNTNLSHFYDTIKSMFSYVKLDHFVGVHRQLLYGIIVSSFICFGLKNSNEMLASFKPNHKTLLFTLMLFAVSVILLLDTKAQEFLYFNF